MEEEKIIEDGNNEIAVEQSTPVVEETPVEQPVVETPVVETPAEPVSVEQPAPAPVAEPIAAPFPEAPKKKSTLPIILVIILLLAVGGFAVWYFVLGGNGAKKEQKEVLEQEEKKEEEKKEEEDKKEDETISEELLTELKTIALLDTKAYTTYYNPLLELNDVPETLSNVQKEYLIYAYAQRSNLLKKFNTMDACLGGSGICYGISQENINVVLKKYGITNFDTSKLREYDGTYIIGGSGDATKYNLNHNITSVKDGDSIIITDKMDLILIATKEKDGEKTKEYTFKKNNDGDYYLSNVADK